MCWCGRVNTAFLINTEDNLAITYNDMSPLENMHCATAFHTAKETRVLEELGEEGKRMLRKQVVAIVLATDMAQHFSLVAKFKAKVGKWSAAAMELGSDSDIDRSPRTPGSSPRAGPSPRRSPGSRYRKLVPAEGLSAAAEGLSATADESAVPSFVSLAMNAGADDRLEVLPSPSWP